MKKQSKTEIQMSQVQQETAVQREMVLADALAEKHYLSLLYVRGYWLIPHLGPEFVEAILQRESNVPVDLQPDSKSITETSPTALCSQSRISGRTGDGSHQHSIVRKTWHRICSFWMKHILGGE